MDVGGVEPLPIRVVLVEFVCGVRERSEERAEEVCGRFIVWREDRVFWEWGERDVEEIGRAHV